MSQSTTNNAYVTKSMNGIISYDDGAGGSMEGGVITCNTLATPLLEADGLQAYTAGASCNLYTQTTGGASSIRIGNAGIVLYVDSGIASTSPIYCSELHAANMYAGTSINTTFLDTPFPSDLPYLWPFVTGQITIGSATSPIIGNYVATANNHLANKQYVDSIIPTSLLGLTNVWTGASNTFNNKIITTTIEAPSAFTNVFLYPNNTTSSISIGSGLTTGILNLGDNMTAGNINIGATSISTGNATILIGNDGTGATNALSLRTLGTLNLGSKAGTINLGIGSSAINIGTTAATSNVIQMANSSTISLNLGNTMTTGGIGIGGALTTGAINIGRTAGTGTINLQNGGTMNLGVASSVLNIGTTSCPTISIGNTTTTSLTLNTPINPNYDTKYTLGTGAPAGCIGQILAATLYRASTIMTNGVSYTMGQFTDIPIGVWLFLWEQTFSVPSTNAVITNILMVGGTTAGGTQVALVYAEGLTRTLAVSSIKSYSLSQTYCNTTATNDIYFNILGNFSGTLTANTNTNFTLKAIRLA